MFQKIIKTTKKKIGDKIKIIPQWLRIAIAFFLIVSSILINIIFLYRYSYRDKIYRNVYIGGLSLSGKNREQAGALIQAKIDNLASKGIAFEYNDDIFILSPIISTGLETGLAYELWSYDSQKIIEELYSFGRGKNWLNNILDQLRLVFVKSTLTANFQINELAIKKVLEENFSGLASPAQNAKFGFSDGTISIIPEEKGEIFDYFSVISLLKQRLSKIENSKITLTLMSDNPKITLMEAENLLPEAQELLNLAPLKLSFSPPIFYTGRKQFYKSEWRIDRNCLEKWIEIKYSNENIGDTGIKKIYLGINKKIVGEYLLGIAKTINIPAQDAKFAMIDGKVVEWQSSADGFVLDIAETLDHIEIEFIKNKNNNVDLILAQDKSTITNENVNNFGINEFIGTGKSNFQGSPENRRYNIAHGTRFLNGILIKPNEEFSLLRALGAIDAESGYKPELVIKEGKTVYEYGGGLCQIGTTMFRLAINSGLPITERRNHSYRVGYYEPAGTDAAIYDPWPDLKFINDTNNYLLLQTRIEGDNLIFDFFGTSDNRRVEITEPVIYNIKTPFSTKYIETENLDPGEKKLLEHAHNGADAYFIRTIIWPEQTNKEVVQETWQAHYVPWQEVYLIGKIPTTTDKNF